MLIRTLVIVCLSDKGILFIVNISCMRIMTISAFHVTPVMVFDNYAAVKSTYL